MSLNDSLVLDVGLRPRTSETPSATSVSLGLIIYLVALFVACLPTFEENT